MFVTHYPEFFAAVATAAAALTGLLFVAMSVAPRPAPADGPPAIIRQVRAAAALAAFVNALAVSLFGLVPGNGVATPAAVLGAGGVLFTLAGVRSIVTSESAAGQWPGQLGLVGLLLLIFGTELVAGILLMLDSHRSTPLALLGNALVASLLVGISRAWELVGDRDTGLFSSIAILTGLSKDSATSHAVHAAGTARHPPVGDDSTPGSGGHQPDDQGR